MKKNKPNELKTLNIDVTVDGDNAVLLDWGNLETVIIPKEDWQQIKEHIDLWFEIGSTHTNNINYATVSNVNINNMEISGGE